MAVSRFLYVTTYEKKNGFLLIEVFRKLFNPQNDGHLEQFRVAIVLSGISAKRLVHDSIIGVK